MRPITVTRIASCLVILGFAASCAPAGSTRSAGGDPERIGSAEIRTSSATNAFELVSRLRPNWLKRTSTGSISGGVRSQLILVYLDGNRLGDVSALRTLSVTGIRSVQWLDAVRAAIVLQGIGSDAIAGAIVLRTS